MITKVLQTAEGNRIAIQSRSTAPQLIYNSQRVSRRIRKNILNLFHLDIKSAFPLF